MLVHLLSEGKNIFNHSYSEFAHFLLCPLCWNLEHGCRCHPKPPSLFHRYMGKAEGLRPPSSSPSGKRACKSRLNVFVQILQTEARGDSMYLLRYCKLKHFPFSTKAALLGTDKARKPLKWLHPFPSMTAALKAYSWAEQIVTVTQLKWHTGLVIWKTGSHFHFYFFLWQVVV